MLIQSGSLLEFLVASVTLPIVAVGRLVCSRVLGIIVLMPFDLFVGDETTLVMFTDHLEDSLTVNSSCLRKRTPLQVMGHTTASGELVLTERTKDLGAMVDF